MLKIKALFTRNQTSDKTKSRESTSSPFLSLKFALEERFKNNLKRSRINDNVTCHSPPFTKSNVPSGSSRVSRTHVQRGTFLEEKQQCSKPSFNFSASFPQTLAGDIDEIQCPTVSARFSFKKPYIPPLKLPTLKLESFPSHSAISIASSNSAISSARISQSSALLSSKVIEEKEDVEESNLKESENNMIPLKLGFSGDDIRHPFPGTSDITHFASDYHNDVSAIDSNFLSDIFECVLSNEPPSSPLRVRDWIVYSSEEEKELEEYVQNNVLAKYFRDHPRPRKLQLLIGYDDKITVVKKKETQEKQEENNSIIKKIFDKALHLSNAASQPLEFFKSFTHPPSETTMKSNNNEDFAALCKNAQKGFNQQSSVDSNFVQHESDIKREFVDNKTHESDVENHSPVSPSKNAVFVPQQPIIGQDDLVCNNSNRQSLKEKREKNKLSHFEENEMRHPLPVTTKPQDAHDNRLLQSLFNQNNDLIFAVMNKLKQSFTSSPQDSVTSTRMAAAAPACIPLSPQNQTSFECDISERNINNYNTQQWVQNKPSSSFETTKENYKQGEEKQSNDKVPLQSRIAQFVNSQSIGDYIGNVVTALDKAAMKVGFYLSDSNVSEKSNSNKHDTNMEFCNNTVSFDLSKRKAYNKVMPYYKNKKNNSCETSDCIPNSTLFVSSFDVNTTDLADCSKNQQKLTSSASTCYKQNSLNNNNTCSHYNNNMRFASYCTKQKKNINVSVGVNHKESTKHRNFLLKSINKQDTTQQHLHSDLNSLTPSLKQFYKTDLPKKRSYQIDDKNHENHQHVRSEVLGSQTTNKITASLYLQHNKKYGLNNSKNLSNNQVSQNNKMCCGRSNFTEEEIMAKTFATNFWKESNIHPIKERQSPPNLWQQLWHHIDPKTRETLEQRHHNKVIRAGQSVITRQKWNAQLEDRSKQYWRCAALSHIELTLFSIENVPYIGQVVIETGLFRTAMPFNCRFLRLPYIDENQVVTLWFNSPVGRSQRSIRDPVIGLNSSDNDWIGKHDIPDEDIDLTHPANADEDELTEEELQKLVDERIHPNSDTYNQASAGYYTPNNDFTTFFKFEIPLQALLQSGGAIECAALIDPKGYFYSSYAERTPKENFDELLQGAKITDREPLLKFRAAVYIQGPNYLVTTGDVMDKQGQEHYIALPPSSKNIMSTKLIYVALRDDETDKLVGRELNREDQKLLRDVGPNAIKRIGNEKYFLNDIEVDIRKEYITLEEYPEFDFTWYSYYTGIDYASNSIYLPMVYCETFRQPLCEFLRKLRTNQIFKYPTQTSIIHPSFIPENKLPKLSVNPHDIELPYEAQKNPRAISLLYLHAQAILENLRLSYYPKDQQAPQLSHEHRQAIQPPYIQLDPNEVKAPVTFAWDPNDIKCISIIKVDTSLGPHGNIPYLIPYQRSNECRSFLTTASTEEEDYRFTERATAETTTTATTKNLDPSSMISLNSSSSSSSLYDQNNLMENQYKIQNLTLKKNILNSITAPYEVLSSKNVIANGPNNDSVTLLSEKLCNNFSPAIDPNIKIMSSTKATNDHKISTEGFSPQKISAFTCDTIEASMPTDDEQDVSLDLHSGSEISSSFQSSNHDENNSHRLTQQLELESNQKSSIMEINSCQNHYSENEKKKETNCQSKNSKSINTALNSHQCLNYKTIDSIHQEQVSPEVTNPIYNEDFNLTYHQRLMLKYTKPCQDISKKPLSPSAAIEDNNYSVVEHRQWQKDYFLKQRQKANEILLGPGNPRYCYAHTAPSERFTVNDQKNPLVTSNEYKKKSNASNSTNEFDTLSEKSQSTMSTVSSNFSTARQRITTKNPKTRWKENTPFEYHQTKTEKERMELHKRIYKEQKINKIVRSRDTEEELGFTYSYVNSFGHIVIPPDPPLPPMKCLELMSREQRLRLKYLRKQALQQLILDEMQHESRHTKAHERVTQNLEEHHLLR